jgi:predicted CXXCH cytochrome family protein
MLGVGSALLVAMSGVGPAQADNGPHVTSAAGSGFDQLVGNDMCATCHRANTAQAGTSLTTNRDVMCLDCHGRSGVGASTNVLDGVGGEVGGTQSLDGNAAGGALRGGGFDYARIGSGKATREIYLDGSSQRARNQLIPVLAAGQATTSSHRVNGATATASGNVSIGSGAGTAVALECVSCHDPHGNGQYRILRSLPFDSGTLTPAVGVRIPDASVKVYTTTNYWLTGDSGVPPVVNGVNVGTAVPDGYIGNVAQWCSTCHHLDNCPKRRKTGMEANCITCHVAHGSNASMTGAKASSSGSTGSLSATNASLSAAPGGSATSPVSGRLLRVDNGDACVMCHTV